MKEGMTISSKLREAIDLPNGARFFKCALQINPFSYLSRHAKEITYADEKEYNDAIITCCLEQGVEVIGVTDHYRIHQSTGLIKAARDAGIFAFAGFEAVTKDGVHFLCLFDPHNDSFIERFIGECGIRSHQELSPSGTLDCTELLQCAKQWPSVCIAAHVAADGGGLLKKLSGQTRMNVWKSQDLLACALAGPISDSPISLRPILENKDPQHKRERPIAVINAQDVNSPQDLCKLGSSCHIKMCEVSIEGLRQAFLDPSSRLRLNSDDEIESHAEFVALTWEGGFLRETGIHFNESLNVVVGGRGTGKSTMIESLRYVLGLIPLGEDARKAHDGVIKQVLKNGTKISLLVRSHKPSYRCYTIERTIPHQPVVRDESGALLVLKPLDVLPGIEVFGQHEISELTKSREKLTRLLERFVETDTSAESEKIDVVLGLEQSRSNIISAHNEIRITDERLSVLPGLEETLKRYQESGLEERLKEKSQLVREEAIFKAVNDRLTPIRVLERSLKTAKIDNTIVQSKALKGLTGADILGQIEAVYDRLNDKISGIAAEFSSALKTADDEINALRAIWNGRRVAIDDTYEKALRELQKSNVDGEEFIRLRRQIEELRPLKEERDQKVENLKSLEEDRRSLVVKWEDIKASEYRAIAKAAKKVSKKLKDKVRVEVTMSGNREPLARLLREGVGGNLSVAIEKLQERSQLSLSEFAARCREGKEALVKQMSLPAGAAERIAQAGLDFSMRLEELDLPATTKIELNTAAEESGPTWQALENLSTGQKATAVLLLLLLESEAPLVVDQPEDDLDNRFISDGIVPIMKQEKRRRQFIFSTHNANIPVLGDAELILGLGASGEGKDGQAMIDHQHMGSIDSRIVREMVEEVLEGGKTAFETRRLKYGF